MNRTPLLAAVFLLCALSASAQSFEQQVGDASAAAAGGIAAVRKAAASAPSFSAQGAPTQYAKSIVCFDPPQASSLPKDLKFYTHLDGKPVSKLPVDDTASRLNDYRGSGLQNDGKWHYDAWSCDTQDYWFTFDAQSLLKATAGETRRDVKGHARVETRGQIDWEGDLVCVANW
ncbi:MAG: hypothetical protein ACHQ51_09675 [Elusimicrobiota bacterium]